MDLSAWFAFSPSRDFGHRLGPVMVNSGLVSDRLFVALWPTRDAMDAIERAVAPLQERYVDLRWQPPQRWHITIAFLGEREPERELRRFSRLTGLIGGPVRIHGSGRFGPVLWLGVDAAWVPDVARTVRKAHYVEERRFHPHITVARARTTAGQRQRRRGVADLAQSRVSRWTAHELTLVRSTIGPSPVYEVIARSPLTVDPS